MVVSSQTNSKNQAAYYILQECCKQLETDGAVAVPLPIDPYLFNASNLPGNMVEKEEDIT